MILFDELVAEWVLARRYNTDEKKTRGDSNVVPQEDVKNTMSEVRAATRKVNIRRKEGLSDLTPGISKAQARGERQRPPI